MPKDAVFTVKLETELRDAFVAEAVATDRPASQLVREFMRDYVEQRRQEREHDAWFRARVEEALADPGPGIPHDEMMAELRARIEARSTEAAKRAR